MNRREAIIAGLSGSLIAGCTSLAEQSCVNLEKSLGDSNVLKSGNPGIDRERASYIMREAGVDAVLLHKPENIYYLTGYWAALIRAGLTRTTFAIMPQDVRAPIILLCSQFTYYYSIAEADVADGVEVQLVTWDKGGQAAEAMFFSDDGINELPLKEKNRRDKTLARQPFHASINVAVKSVLEKLGVLSGRLGYDSIEAMQQLENISAGNHRVLAENIVKHLRLIKTPREIGLMQQASANNVAAALATAGKARGLVTSTRVRNEFIAEAAKRGSRFEFMVVNSSIDQQYDEELKDGTTVLIDCVSSYYGYYGDYGRTIFIGEPAQKMKEKVKVMGESWNELKQSLRPGMSFSDIQREGAEILKKMGHAGSIPFAPHSVGLAHTEQPKFSLDGSAVDLKLEKGMIISVDCPLMQASTLGSAHLEDLTLITESGSMPIHDPGNQVVIV